MLLGDQHGIEIVGEAGTAAEALLQADTLHPDVVLMDVGLPDVSGIQASAEIKRRHPGIAIVALSLHKDRAYINRMLAAGACDYVLKQAAPDDLLPAIRNAIANP
jgi:DNA-binding NarL/FixJ family response regulator